MKMSAAVLVVLSCALGGQALAAEQELRPKISLGYQGVLSDKNRNTGAGDGAFVTVDKSLNSLWDLEFGSFYERYRGGAKEWTDYGGNLGALFYYSRAPRFSPYLGLAVGGAVTKLDTAPGAKSSDPYVEAGLGFFKYFASAGGTDLGLRADVRYRWLDATDIPGQHGFREPIARVGLVIPLGARVIELPPPADSDGDGVIDPKDLCPNTPRDTRVDASGCPLPLKVAAAEPAAPLADADHDGVPDVRDECPGTPAGVKVNLRGCPLDADGDGDGVLDDVDTCPNTTPGLRVGPDGCVILEVQKVVLKNVNFEFNSAKLTKEAQAALDDVAQGLKNQRNLKVEIAGHTDFVGGYKYNLKLSQHRADSARAYLVSKGVPASQLTSKGYADTVPLTSNMSAAGRAQNRRVEFHVLAK